MLAPPLRVRGLAAISDTPIILGAAAVAVGAWLAWNTPVWLGAVVLLAALALRLPVLLPIGLLLAGAALAHRQLDTLRNVTTGEVNGEVMIVEDPEWRFGALSFAVLDASTGNRWQGQARGRTAYALEDALVGERWHVVGTTSAAAPESTRFLWPKHLAGRLQVTSATKVNDGAAPHRIANSIRRTIERSGASLSQRDRALLAGFVYGDERDQLPEVQHDFRASALTHLLAVSGSNVVFVLLLAAPLLIRLRLWWKVAAVVLLLAEFALLTRAEPSVLRAAVMATLVVTAQAMGRSATVGRVLALAVIVLVLFDPLLVRSAGFQLSVAASAGIVLLAGRLAEHLPGPRWVRLALSVTLAAQLGVLPVQLLLFGSLPLVSVPANLLAVPVAGPTMVWGLVAGVAGGLAGEPIAAWLHLPTQVMVGWVASVARWGSGLGWPQLEASELPWLAAAVAAGVGGYRLARGSPRWRLVAVVGCALGVFAAAASSRPAPPATPQLSVTEVVASRDTAAVGNTHPGGAGARTDTHRRTVVVVDRPSPVWALGQLATAGIRSIDVMVVRSPSNQAVEAVETIAARTDVGELWVPEGFPNVRNLPIRRITAPTQLDTPLSGHGTLAVTHDRELAAHPPPAQSFTVEPSGSRLTVTPSLGSAA